MENTYCSCRLTLSPRPQVYNADYGQSVRIQPREPLSKPRPVCAAVSLHSVSLHTISLLRG